MKIFLDMDGVLVDWCRGAHELHGLPYDANNWPYKRGPEGWDWGPQAGIKYAWDKMDQEFWAGLEWVDDGFDILLTCEDATKSVCLLTSPAHTPGAIEGRIDWVNDVIPAYRKSILIGNCKEMCAAPGHVLVDDYDVNIDKWRAAGGVGILLPRPWNSNERYAHDSVAFLKQSLEKL